MVRANSGRYSSSVESDVFGWQALTIAFLLSLYAACVGSGRRDSRGTRSTLAQTEMPSVRPALLQRNVVASGQADCDPYHQAHERPGASDDDCNDPELSAAILGSGHDPLNERPDAEY